jgi:hypothetical protein
LPNQLPYVEFSAVAELRIEDVGDLLGRQGVGEQVLGLSSVAKQIGAHREARGKFLDDPVQRGRRDGAERGRRPRHRSQVGLIQLLEESRSRRFVHLEQQGRGFFGAAEFPFALGSWLRHRRPSANFALCHLFETSAGDDFEQRHAEALSGFIDDDDLAACDHRAIDDDVDWIADTLVERNDSATGKLHEAGDGQRCRAEHDLHCHRDRKDRAQIGMTRYGLRLWPVYSALKLGEDGGFVHG